MAAALGPGERGKGMESIAWQWRRVCALCRRQLTGRDGASICRHWSSSPITSCSSANGAIALRIARASSSLRISTRRGRSRCSYAIIALHPSCVAISLAVGLDARLPCRTSAAPPVGFSLMDGADLIQRCRQQFRRSVRAEFVTQAAGSLDGASSNRACIDPFIEVCPPFVPALLARTM